MTLGGNGFDLCGTTIRTRAFFGTWRGTGRLEGRCPVAKIMAVHRLDGECQIVAGHGVVVVTSVHNAYAEAVCSNRWRCPCAGVARARLRKNRLGVRRVGAGECVVQGSFSANGRSGQGDGLASANERRGGACVERNRFQGLDDAERVSLCHVGVVCWRNGHLEGSGIKEFDGSGLGVRDDVGWVFGCDCQVVIGDGGFCRVTARKRVLDPVARLQP